MSSTYRKVDSIGSVNVPIDIVRRLSIAPPQRLAIITVNRTTFHLTPNLTGEAFGLPVKISSHGRLVIPLPCREWAGIIPGSNIRYRDIPDGVELTVID